MKALLERLSFHVFTAFERIGVHVLPAHYYSAVADRSWLRKRPDAWRRRVEIVGVEWDLDRQLAWLEGMCRGYYEEVSGLEEFARVAASSFGPGYGRIESQVLHCVIRSLAPARVTEVGGGATTALMLAASGRNAAEGRGGAEVVTIEPFPAPALLALEGATVVRDGAQTAPAELFARLGRGDLLFIDSTHVLRTGSELSRLYLEVIPSLAAGVIVHVHDVTLPYLYIPDVLASYFDWQESALVLALLVGNPSLRVLCCESALHADRQDELQRVLHDYRPLRMHDGLADDAAEGDFPSSLWLEVV